MSARARSESLAVRGTKGRESTVARTETSKLTERLVALGLTQNESRVYLMLLRAGEATAAEAAVGAGVPRPKVYEALTLLEGRGFCRSAGGRVSRYSPVEPEAAIDGWIRHRDLERSEQADRDREIGAALVQALPRGRAKVAVDVPDFIEGISGRLPTTEALEAMMGRATKSLVEMLQPPFLQPRSRWNIMETGALARGVSVRIVYTPEAIEDPRRYEDLVDHGGEIRVIDKLPMKLLVRDDEEALISLRDSHTGAQSLSSAVVRHPDLVAPLRKLFEDVWSEAKPLTR